MKQSLANIQASRDVKVSPERPPPACLESAPILSSESVRSFKDGRDKEGEMKHNVTGINSNLQLYTSPLTHDVSSIVSQLTSDPPPPSLWSGPADEVLELPPVAAARLHRAALHPRAAAQEAAGAQSLTPHPAVALCGVGVLAAAGTDPHTHIQTAPAAGDPRTAGPSAERARCPISAARVSRSGRLL